ncbi:tRNA pseudouridine(38-40) synthase TruA [Thermotoga sp. KOL6]|uniref:tRNA pseudouridine(38-40) synthase TruA n=1 Tax=Thermotoga sp. KOL6 TaxID=126741 RepID=UPI000C7878EC|nr:tRNA pseudouridine(38-40) synthase TruA [Thermotoga sp. KOL6]PLV60373.1 tRNA pseudouridine synthase [Thermotoga sp. KOL6]
MKRVAAVIEYDGSNFFGFQGQPDVRTVQGIIEDALERIFKQRVYTQAAGRTDAGVHANGQLIAFNCPNDRMSTEDIKNAMNANLPDDVYVKKVFEVPKNFHPRFDVTKRIYHYFIDTSKERNVFSRKYVWWFPYELDLNAMRKAAKYLEGTHDFTSFKTGSDERDPVRTIYRIRILKLKRNIVLIRVEGRSFLRRMVRNIVAALVKVGLGHWKPEKMKEVLEARDRSAAAGTAPAHGLYFYKVLF